MASLLRHERWAQETVQRGSHAHPIHSPPSILPLAHPSPPSHACAQVLIGNKSDIPDDKRVISTKMGQALADEFGVAFFETSAKSGALVEDSFLHISRDVKNRLEAEQPEGAAPVASVRVSESASKAKKKKTCC